MTPREQANHLPHAHYPTTHSYPSLTWVKLRRGCNGFVSGCAHDFGCICHARCSALEHCARHCEELAPFSPKGPPSQSFSFRSRSARPERVGQSRLARARPATTKSNPSPALHFPIQAAGSHLLGRPVARHAPVPRFSVYFGTSATGESRAAFGWVSSQITLRNSASSSFDISNLQSV